MSSDGEAPEAVNVSDARIAYEEQERASRFFARQKSKAQKKKRKRTEGELESVQDDAEKDEGESEEDEFLSEEVMAAVLDRGRKQEAEEKLPVREHGTVVEVGNLKPKAMEIKKGPVKVRVLNFDSITETPSDSAFNFRQQMMRRHRRTRAVLGK